MATTIVDALVVTLGLDLAAFKRGKAEAAQITKKMTAEELAAAKQIEERNKIAADSFRRVRNEVLALAAVFTAGVGLKDFVSNTVNSAINLGYMSQNLKMSTRDLSAWQRAAERAGSSADAITGALQQSQAETAGVKIGQVSSGVQSFLRWGGKVEDLKDGNTYLMARARIISNMFKVDPARAHLIAQAMGITDDTFNFIKQGPAAIQQLVDAQKKNSAITEQQAAQALKLKNEWLDLRDRLLLVGTTVTLQLMPLFERWIAQLEQLADWVANHKDDIGRWVQEAAGDVEKFVKTVDHAAQSIGGWKTILEALIALKVLSVVSPLLQLASALTGVGGGLAGIALRGPAALAALGLLAEWGRKNAFDQSIPAGPNHDQQVADAMASGDGAAVTTPEDGSAPVSGWGALGEWAKKTFGAPTSAVISGRQQYVMAQLKKAGYSDAQAAGIVGNLMQESSFNPNAENQGHRGLAQWDAARQAQFQHMFGHPLAASRMDEQVQFMLWELNNTEKSTGDRVRAARTVREATLAFSQGYERAGVGAMDPKRLAYANQIYAGVGQANAALIAQQTALAAAPAPSHRVNNTTNSAETHFNVPITVNTQATDAKGVAQGLGGELRRYQFTVAQADSGMVS